MDNKIFKQKMIANSKIYDEGIKRLYILNTYASRLNDKCQVSLSKEIYNLHLLLSYIKPTDTYDYANKGFSKSNGMIMANWQLESLYPSPDEFLKNLNNLKNMNNKIINIPQDIELPKFDFDNTTEQINNITDYKDLIYFEGFLLQDLSFKVLSKDLEKENNLLEFITYKKYELYMNLSKIKKL